MKKEIRQLSKLTGWFFRNLLVIGLLFPVYVVAQTKKNTPTPQKTYWYMDFTVTIKGYGKHTNEYEDRITEWRVDRFYSGVIKLNDSMSWYKQVLSTEERIEALKSQRFTAFHYRPVDLTKIYLMPLFVRINDFLVVTIKDRGEGSAFENTTINTLWQFNWPIPDHTPVYTQNTLRLSTDNKLRTYNVLIPILPVESHKPEMILFSDTTVDRSANGYGDAQTHEKTPLREIPVSIHSLGIPDVKGLIEDGAVKHIPNDFLFPGNFMTAWGYDSFEDFPDLNPDEPIYPTVPDSKTKVKIRVTYRFSKTPLK